ncbi:ATP-binding protein [Pedobacter sp. KR3-3]|uniref:Oxygen sensor histidine kinase NreB n=1 Tax=Pedobacter albus TaxID=3113905 RepID=A0ABU7I9L7_9SPHI|nr:ATP-binding protein [Pedobacter sp. KR3-3]MEE1946156.1 ATP-binding protein [Pedobacter sp. KR3-3]
MPAQSASLSTAIILISILFFIIALGLVFLVGIYNQRRKLHVEEKRFLNQKFDAELLKTQIEVQEQTMQTIAADLHDNIGQLLSLTTLTLGSIDINAKEKAQKKVNDSLSLVNKSIQELRELAKLLQGEQIVALGLGHALQQECDWLKRTKAYKLQFNNQLVGLDLNSPNKDLIILRLVQEIFNNIIKHAQAKHIAVEANLNDGILYLNVKEDGIGFDYESIKKASPGMGLASLQKRIALINGVIDIYSEPKLGTSITIEIPYP